MRTYRLKKASGKGKAPALQAGGTETDHGGAGAMPGGAEKDLESGAGGSKL